MRSGACAAHYALEGDIYNDRWVIPQPPVNAASTTMSSYVFHPNDEVLVQAGGCVQTGGLGKTWKRYVDPLGGSNQYYFGEI